VPVHLKELSLIPSLCFTAHTDEAIESHRGDMADDGTPLQTEAPMCGQQSIAGYIRMHLAIAQDEVGEDRRICRKFVFSRILDSATH
jgi:hypothetical protein